MSKKIKKHIGKLFNITKEAKKFYPNSDNHDQKSEGLKEFSVVRLPGHTFRSKYGILYTQLAA